jgi:hypothetical protein
VPVQVNESWRPKESAEKKKSIRHIVKLDTLLKIFFGGVQQIERRK